jgi:FkbM family methyltransferase
MNPLSRLKKRLNAFTDTCLSFLTAKVLPERLLIFIKSKTKVVKKMDYEGQDIYLNVDSEIERNTRLHSCRKERETVEWIQKFFKDGDVFYDIGANVGAYSLVAAKFLQGKGRIYAFEPAFPNFAQLGKNIFINGCADSVTPFQVALSDETKIDRFNYENLVPGGALHALGKPVDYKGDLFKPVLTLPVLTFRLDDLVERFRIPYPNHIKVDVDGTELRVLKGAEKTLAAEDLRSILVEIEEGDQEAAETLEWLHDKGFALHEKYKYTPQDDTGPLSKVYNYIFSSKKTSRTGVAR